MGLLDVLGFRSNKTDRFFALFAAQGDVVRRGTDALATLRDGDATAKDVATLVQEIEHEGDKLVRDVEAELARSFVTPLDREDLRAIAISADDVIDKVNLTARSFVLFGVATPSAPMRELIDLLRASGSDLSSALAAPAAGKLAEVAAIHRRIKDAERKGDHVFRSAIAALFRDAPLDGRELLREKEILEDLEEALDLCEDTAETLVRIAVKHG